MKHKLLVVVLILAVLSMFTVMGAQASGQEGLAGFRDATGQYHHLRAQWGYTGSISETAGPAFQVSWWSGIRRFQFRWV